MEKVKFVVELEVSFHSYKDKKLNHKAKTAMKKWIRETIEDNLNYIPLYVEKDENGTLCEDITGKTKFKVKKV